MKNHILLPSQGLWNMSKQLSCYFKMFTASWSVRIISHPYLSFGSFLTGTENRMNNGEVIHQLLTFYPQASQQEAIHEQKWKELCRKY